MRANVIFVILLAILSVDTFAQPQFPDPNPIFTDDEVPRIDIEIVPDTLAWIYDHPESDLEFHANFSFTSGEIQETFENIGFRLRGNTSRYSAKKSFKVSFNTFVSGGDFYGVEKLNLNGEHNDPSVCRAKIGWDLARMTGLPGSRANHVALYINGNYHGLYLSVEHIDEEFTGTYFGTKTGNLYKCLYPADLVWKGSDPDLYKEEYSGRRAYELKINEETDDYTDLRDLIDAINHSSPETFPMDLGRVINTPDLLKLMALEIILGHWDNYIYNKNNYYLYHNPLTEQFEFLLYDLDNTMGIDWSGINWDTRNLYNWDADWEPRPLYNSIMSNTILRDQFTYYILDYASLISAPEFTESIFSLRDLIRPYLIDDPYYPLDYDFSVETFDQSFTGGAGNHVKQGILPYLASRANAALAQAEQTDMFPIIKYSSHNTPGAYNSFRVSVFAEDNQNGMTVELYYRFNGGTEETEQLFDDGLHGDGIAGDGYYGGSLEPFAQAGQLKYNFCATDNLQQKTFLYAEMATLEIAAGGNYPLYINEFMADNKNTIMDEYGEYDDWIELWNGGELPIHLEGMYLSDKPENPSKWRFPDVTIQPGAFLLLWTDDDNSQGLLHTNFKLSKAGEFIGLYDQEATGYAMIDNISFGVQQTDVSFGREYDGAIQFIAFNEPTPGRSNNENAVEEIEAAVLNVFPIPACEMIWLDGAESLIGEQFEIVDLLGTTRMNIRMDATKIQLSIAHLKPGIYYLVCTKKELIRKLIIK